MCNFAGLLQDWLESTVNLGVAVYTNENGRFQRRGSGRSALISCKKEMELWRLWAHRLGTDTPPCVNLSKNESSAKQSPTCDPTSPAPARRPVPIVAGPFALVPPPPRLHPRRALSPCAPPCSLACSRARSPSPPPTTETRRARVDAANLRAGANVGRACGYSALSAVTPYVISVCDLVRPDAIHAATAGRCTHPATPGVQIADRVALRCSPPMRTLPHCGASSHDVYANSPQRALGAGRRAQRAHAHTRGARRFTRRRCGINTVPVFRPRTSGLAGEVDSRVRRYRLGRRGRDALSSAQPAPASSASSSAYLSVYSVFPFLDLTRVGHACTPFSRLSLSHTVSPLRLDPKSGSDSNSDADADADAGAHADADSDSRGRAGRQRSFHSRAGAGGQSMLLLRGHAAFLLHLSRSTYSLLSMVHTDTRDARELTTSRLLPPARRSPPPPRINVKPGILQDVSSAMLRTLGP
ncbi:hypothetical protein B0H17DRAFT_1142557 [Mycena rosella]|uniref:Uncharacterized protein n=1 Tax=Mycena rosella TaxID=1033263 RepID=A0AAD7G521_MYCRO|nr:hypothetical protein B0H17DRAFT_1142557 [Mycena rosella]